MSTENHAACEPSDFIREIVAADLAAGRYREIVTRFPPEPNGYLHIGHAKSICLNFGIARQFGGRCNLRMDDTNPAKEETEYVESIIADVHWLIDGWADHVLAPDVYFASEYFEGLYDNATRLIRKGKAYVCDLTAEQLIEFRGAPDGVGRESPFRDRSMEENLDLFARMRAGEFPDGARTLRAKIDMASPNIHLRDPALYRIRHAAHHRTANKWCIYPMYDYAHCLSDSIEGISHSICTLEFEVHRPLYDWILEQLVPEPRPHQYEFARLNLSYTVMSKRKLLELVQEKLVSGWDDPRMPTIAGLRRRGITPAALRQFAQMVGVTKYNGVTDVALLEHAIRDDLNKNAVRRLAVLHPIKLVITNYPEDKVEELDAVNNPEDPSTGTRAVPFSRELYIDHDDFREVPPPKYFRLRPGGEVRLKYALHYPLRRGGERRRRERDRTALHGGSSIEERWRLREPQSQRDDSLGQREARHRRRGPALRPALHRPGTRFQSRRFQAIPQSRLAPKSSPAKSSHHCVMRTPSCAISSSASAISASIRVRPAGWFSIEPSA